MRQTMRYGLAAVATALAAPATAQETTWTLYGTPGIIEMPSARSAPDAEIATSFSYWNLQQKGNFTFQITDRLTGTFRYGGISERNGPGTDGTFDRSFDLRYRILDETELRPAIAIGLQDFLGTGILSAEYIVATKAVTPQLDVTAGLGWGRFGTRNPLFSPLGERPALDFGQGGRVSYDQFFRGDAALFGGLDYRVSDKLSLQVEYSSDAYLRETSNGSLTVNAPINVGLSYRARPGLDIDLAYLYGSELAAGITLTVNPKNRPLASGLETAPVPVRPAGAAAAASWGEGAALQDQLRAGLKSEGAVLHGLTISGDTARMRYTNTRFRSEAEAMGRVARVATNVLPDGVTTFVLEPMQNGLPLSATSLRRADLARFETAADGAAGVRAASTTTDALAAGPVSPVPVTEPRLSWGLSPYLQLIVFNGNDPVQTDVGLNLAAKYSFAPNLVVSGSIRQSALGPRTLADEFQAPNDYPDVRTDARFYGLDGTPTLQSLQLAYYGRPATNLYSRVSLGYFEQMYGGVSTEVLWKPVDSKLALGAELTYAVQRDFDVGFAFRDFDTVTGFLSGYYDFDNGFHGQVDVGRYLAGDWGATFSLDREFDNGWAVGAYFTLTDMPFDQFGEGSFDKGIRMTVPTDFFLGNTSRRKISTNLSSLTRDGGARVAVDGRLYETVRQGHTAGGLGDTFGRFWR